MPFRFFLLSLCLIAAAAEAQETTATPAPTTAVPAAAPDAAPAAIAPGQVPLDAASLLTVGVPHSKEERDEMAQRATALQEESRLRKDGAEKTLSAAKTACWKKFLVSSCLDDAKVAYRKDVTIAKRQDREAQTLERNVRKYDAAEHARLRDEENAKRDEENAKKAERYRAKRAADEQKHQGATN